MSRHHYLRLFHVLALSWAMMGVVGCDSAGNTQETATPEIIVPITQTPVVVRPVQRKVMVSGTLLGLEDIYLTTKVDGRVLAIYHDVGDEVIPGDILLEQEPLDYQLAVNRMEKALSAELARISLTELPTASFDPELVPSVRRAEAALVNAQKSFERIRSLTNPSKVEYDTAESELKIAQASKREALAGVQAILAAAKLQQAMLAEAKQRLEDCRLIVPVPNSWHTWAAVTGPGFTPMNYAVAQRMVSTGEMIRSMPVTNVFRLVVAYRLKLRATLPERFIVDIQTGQKVEVRVDAYDDQAFLGRVTRINPTVDTTTRTFSVEIEIPNLDRRLKPGGFARGDIFTKLDEAVKMVPPQAIISFAGVNKVFIVDGETAKAVEVEIGIRDGQLVEVRGKIDVNQNVITSGLTQIVDGSKIRLR